MLRLAFDFIITWRETRTRPNAYDSWIRKAVNGVNLMAEVVPGYTDVKEDLTFNPNGPKYQMNVGMEYSFWKDYINAVIELNRCKYFSGGIYFKIHLK